MKDFRDLQVWSKSHTLTLRAYEITAGFPKCEIYGLTSQIRRCSASVAANIAEGCGKRGNAEFQLYLGIAAGSASALEYHFLQARDLHLVAEGEYENLNYAVAEIKRMLSSLICKIEGGSQSWLNAKC